MHYIALDHEMPLPMAQLLISMFPALITQKSNADKTPIDFAAGNQPVLKLFTELAKPSSETREIYERN